MTVDRVWLWFVPVHGEHSVTSRRALMMFFGVNLSMTGWLVGIWKITIFNGQIHYNICWVLWNHGLHLQHRICRHGRSGRESAIEHQTTRKWRSEVWQLSHKEMLQSWDLYFNHLSYIISIVITKRSTAVKKNMFMGKMMIKYDRDTSSTLFFKQIQIGFGSSFIDISQILHVCNIFAYIYPKNGSNVKCR